MSSSDIPPLVRVEGFAPGGAATFAVSTRAGGVSPPPFASLNLGAGVGDGPANVAENRERVARALGVDRARMVFVRQVHGRRVVRVEAPWPPGAEPPEADGLVTATPGLALAVLTADCAAVAVCDPVRGAAALVHAGWRGTVAGIAQAAVEALVAGGSRVDDLRAAIGPCIGPCCYEVGDEVIDAFAAAWPRGVDAAVRRGDDPGAPVSPAPESASDRRTRAHFDLRAANVHVLGEAGVPPDRIVHVRECTACRTDAFFSHRAENGRTGRFGAFVVLHPRG